MVTGGASGMGRAMALAFASEGATLAIGSLTRKTGRAMQGEITVSSNAGAGSTFAVRLPLWRDGENDAS